MILALLAGKWGPILIPTLKKPCKLGLEPQSTQNDPKLSPNGSRKKTSRHSVCTEFRSLARGRGPGGLISTFFDHFLEPHLVMIRVFAEKKYKAENCGPWSLALTTVGPGPHRGLWGPNFPYVGYFPRLPLLTPDQLP